MAMGSGQMLLFPFLIILIHFANITAAQVPGFLLTSCTYSANYTTNSAYQRNLETVLSSLPSNTSNNYGFYSTSAGQGPNTVNTIALCRGDVSQEICRDCVYNATLRLREDCPNQMEAIGWYDFCLLRYSNASIFHTVGGGLTLYMLNPNNVTSFDEFNADLRDLTDRLQAEAAAGGSLRKFATGNIRGPDFLTIYGLMQCTPDLSEEQCFNCLSGATAQIPTCCDRKQGGRVIQTSCMIRYEIYRFYNKTPPISPPGSYFNVWWN